MVMVNADFERRMNDLARGNHVCLVYDTQAEQTPTTVPFLGEA